MIERLGYLMEMISIVVCIHVLYGRKLKLNIKNIALLSFSVILVQAVNEGVLSEHSILLVYVMVFFYCWAEFGYNKNEIFINNVLNLIVLFMVQIVCWILFVMLQFDKFSTDIQMCFINFMVLMVVIFILPHCKLNTLSRYMQQKNILVGISLTACLLFVVYMLVLFQITDFLVVENYVVVVVSAGLLMVLVYKWQQNRFQVKEQAMELQMYQMYNETFQTLLSEIRSRQHDFENHIQAIYGQHYTANTLEELVEKQKDYCEGVLESNHYNKLLKLGDSTVVGFLYGKFLQAERRKIEVEYKINMENFHSNLPNYKFVEMVGNLFDNAMEAIDFNQNSKRKIRIQLLETEKDMIFTISNPSQYIPQKQMDEMFQRGKSSKGEQRGFGLANVAKICKEYQCKLVVENKTMGDENYIEFMVEMKKW